MRIKKVSQTTPTQAQVVDSLDGSSTTDAPSIHTIKNTLMIVQRANIFVDTLNGDGEKYDQVFNITIPSGYKPIAIVGYGMRGSNYTRIFVNKLLLNNNQITWSVRNSSTLQARDLYLDVDILFIKQ